MLTAKEKVEDMQWFAELFGIYERAYHAKHPLLDEVAAEIERVRTKIATYDYAPLEKRRQASIARLGKESVYW